MPGSCYIDLLCKLGNDFMMLNLLFLMLEAKILF